MNEDREEEKAAKRPARVPLEHQEAMVADYLEGRSMLAAAARWGYSVTACKNALQRAGVATRDALNNGPAHNAKFKLTPTQRQEIVSRYVSGEGPTFLAREFGVCPSNVTSLVRSRGLEIHGAKISDDDVAALVSRYGAGENS